jgi:hypothetical protein
MWLIPPDAMHRDKWQSNGVFPERKRLGDASAPPCRHHDTRAQTAADDGLSNGVPSFQRQLEPMACNNMTHCVDRGDNGF